MKNNKNILAVIAVVAVIVIGAGAYFMFMKDDTKSGSNSSSTDKSAQSNNKNTVSDKSTKGNLYSLSSDTSPKMCTFKYTSTDGSGSSGSSTMYNDGKGNALMDMEVSSTKEDSGKMSTLILGDMVYFWSNQDGKKTGFKYAKPSDINSSSDTASTKASGVDMKQSYDLDCSDWKVDSGKFVIPKDVEFLDMSKLPGAN